MSRCAACDSRLTERDCSRKSPLTGLYYDLCTKCFSTIKHDVDSIENEQLSGEGVDYDDQDYTIPQTSETE